MTYQQLKRREYNSALYKRNRRWILFYKPTCNLCPKNGIISPVEQIDHVIPIGRWYRENETRDGCSELSNLQGLCKKCHKKKSADDLQEYYDYKNRRKPRFDIRGRVIEQNATC